MKIHDADRMNSLGNVRYKSDFAILYCMHNFITHLKNIKRVCSLFDITAAVKLLLC